LQFGLAGLFGKAGVFTGLISDVYREFDVPLETIAMMQQP